MPPAKGRLANTSSKSKQRVVGAKGANVRRKLALVGILLLAFALRLIAIDQIPAGLSHDEAYNGVTAIEVLNGKHAVFFEINKGIEPLIIYLEALSFAAFGIGPVQLRLVNIIFGMLTVALVYPLTARLFDRRIALLAMAGLAISFWAVFVSRLSLRAVLLPPLLALTLYLFWRGLEPQRQAVFAVHQEKIDPIFRSSAQFQPARTAIFQPSNFPTFPTFIFLALSGVTAGATMYTYLSSRFLPFIILIVFVYLAMCRRSSRWIWLGLALHLAIWAAMTWPLVDYFLQHQESFTHRSGQVSTVPYVLNGEFGPLIDNTLLTLGMFTVQGDTTDRYNLDGRPVFDWINGLLFYFGVALVGWQFFRAPSRAAPAFLLFSAVFFMLLPDLVTDDSPHFLRTIGALPLIYIFWAIGLEKIGRGLRAISNWYPVTNYGTRVEYALRNVNYALLPTFYVLLLSLTALHTTYDYFFRWANAPEARHIYGADIAEIAAYLKRSPSEDLPAISAEYYRDLDPFRVALHFGGNPPFVIWFDGTQTLAFPPARSNLSPRYLFPNSAPAADLWAALLKPVPQESGRAYRLYRLPETSPLAQLESQITPLRMMVNNDLVLHGYRLIGDVVAGGKARVLLLWQALRTLPPGTDYTFQIQLRDSQGHLWLAAEGNGYDPDDWQPGVSALQVVTLRFPGDFPPRDYQMTLQVVDRRSGQLLPSAAGDPQVGLGRVRGQLAAKPREIDEGRLPNPIGLELQADNPSPVLRGYDLDRRVVRFDEAVTVTLYWQTMQQPTIDYQLQFYLVSTGDEKMFRWPATDPIGGEWPTSRWPTGYWFRDQIALPVAGDAPTGVFELRGQWVGASDAPVFDFSLGRLEVEPSP